MPATLFSAVPGQLTNAWQEEAAVLNTAVPPRECFSPLLTCLPGTLFAAYRAEQLGEPYFRGFRGGRSREKEVYTRLEEMKMLVDQNKTFKDGDNL